MEIICAGFPKTGSKSCSTALRKLGYNVADYIETASFLSYVWVDFIAGKIDIDEVIAEYQKYNFQANQDIPSNFQWEELYAASPNAKVILTVRDSTEAWHKSFDEFLKEQFKVFGNPGMKFIMELQNMNFMGPKAANMDTLGYHIMNICTPSFNVKKAHWTWQQRSKELTACADEARASYERHNAHVKKTVTADRLLIWNVKDGWEPLCKFLNKPVPEGPIPHENKIGDKKFINDYLFVTDYWKETKSHIEWNLSMLLLKTVGISAGLIHLYKTEGKSVKCALNFVHKTFKS